MHGVKLASGQQPGLRGFKQQHGPAPHFPSRTNCLRGRDGARRQRPAARALSLQGSSVGSQCFQHGRQGELLCTAPLPGGRPRLHACLAGCSEEQPCGATCAAATLPPRRAAAAHLAAACCHHVTAAVGVAAPGPCSHSKTMQPSRCGPRGRALTLYRSKNSQA